MRHNAGQKNITKFYRRMAHHHILFGIAMASAQYNVPFSEGIALYRRRTGDNETTDDALYRAKNQMIVEFKCEGDDVVNL